MGKDNKFPSPTWGLVFIICNHCYNEYDYRFPSPVWGLVFYLLVKRLNSEMQERSVPYSGLIFLFLRPCLDDYPFAEPFPSPIQGLFFFGVELSEEFEIKGFRPLLGAYFLIKTLASINVVKQLTFRPLLGAYFFIDKNG